MKVGDRVTLTRGGEIVESVTTYIDEQKACGYVRFSPKELRRGHIVGIKYGWFRDYWIIGLDNGEIVRIPYGR
jgi:hypothetical protein